MAERGGFEPPIRFNPYTGLANQRLQPLGHLSKPFDSIGELLCCNIAESCAKLTSCNTCATLDTYESYRVTKGETRGKR